MPRYVIERELPGAGKLSQEEFAISQKSCNVIKDLGPSTQWIESLWYREDLLRIPRIG